MKKFVRGDLGKSDINGTPVTTALRRSRSNIALD